MAGFRNILVHGYVDVDPAILFGKQLILIGFPRTSPKNQISLNKGVRTAPKTYYAYPYAIIHAIKHGHIHRDCLRTPHVASDLSIIQRLRLCWKTVLLTAGCAMLTLSCSPVDGSAEMNVKWSGEGSGRVVSPEGIDCGAVCATSFARKSLIRLTAVPDNGSFFEGWSLAECGDTPVCEIEVFDGMQIEALFGIDECLDDPNKGRPGSCGCGKPDTDSDEDETPDCFDLCPNDPKKVAQGGCGCSVVDSEHGHCFPEAQHFEVGNLPGSVRIGDVNGDGRPDLVTANSTSGNVSVLFQKNDGGFHNAEEFAVRDGPSSVAIGDVNGDGRPDLVTANVASGNVSVLIRDDL